MISGGIVYRMLHIHSALYIATKQSLQNGISDNPANGWLQLVKELYAFNSINGKCRRISSLENDGDKEGAKKGKYISIVQYKYVNRFISMTLKGGKQF